MGDSPKNKMITFDSIQYNQLLIVDFWLISFVKPVIWQLLC